MATLKATEIKIPRLVQQALRPLTLLTLAGVCSGFLAYSSLLAPAEERLTQVQAAYEQARRKQVELRQARRTQEDVRKLKGELAGVWTMLPEEQKFASLAIEISELARKVRVAVPGMTYRHTKPKSGLPAKASLSFNATGDYRNIYRFIHRLETTEPYLVIERLDASRTKDATRASSHKVRMNIQLLTYLKPDSSAAEQS